MDVVCQIGDYRPDRSFDTIISVNSFEHDAEYKQSLLNIVRILKPGGLFVFSCSGPGTLEHGTKEFDPTASLSSEIWDHYANLTEEDIRAVLDIDKLFTPYEFKLHNRRKGMGTDLQFWGIML